jgi:hypothetical protein
VLVPHFIVHPKYFPIVVPAMKDDLALVSCRVGDLQRGLGISKPPKSRKVKMISLSFWKEAC